MSRALDWDRLDGLVRSHQLSTLAGLTAESHEFALVGGAVRDALLGRSPDDLDVVVIGSLEGAVDALSACLGRRPADIGDRFQNTHRFIWKGTSVDIAQSLGDLPEDLGRRDLTINALGVPLRTGSSTVQDLVVDPHGGLADLQAGRIRAVSEANVATDPLRALRAVRYVGQLGFEVEPATLGLIERHATDLDDLAAERVAAEWQTLLGSAHWLRALALAWQTGVATAAFGARTSSEATAAWGTAESSPDLAGRLAALLLELEGLPPAERESWLVTRRWPRRLARQASRGAAWSMQEGDDSELAPLAILDPAAAGLAGRLAMALNLPAARLATLAERAAEERWVTGDHLLAAGLPQGAAVGKILDEAAVGQVVRRWPDVASARAWAGQRVGEDS